MRFRSLRSHPAILFLIVGAFIGAMPLAGLAQALADHLPADAILYMGWKGSDTLGPSFDASHLKAVLDASNLPEVFQKFLPELSKRLGEQDEEGGAIMNMAMAVAAPLWKHPTAIYFGGLDFRNPNQPIPHFAIVCDAQADAPALLKQLQGIVGMGGPLPIEIKVKQYGQMVVLTAGEVTPAFEVALTGHGPDRLSDDPNFKASMAQVDKDPVITLYLSGPYLNQQLDGIAAALKNMQPVAAAKWPQIRESLGLGGFKGFISTGAFDGKDWSQQCFIGAALPRKGLMAMLDSKPITEESLKLIPKSATWVGVTHVDLANLVTSLRTTAIEIEPNLAPMIEGGLNQINGALGFDLDKDFLATFGDEWAFYSDPNTGGEGLGGMVLMNHMADAAKAEQSMAKLESFANGLIRKGIGDSKINIRFSEQKIDGLTIHYLDIPMVTPAWTIKDGRLYAGLYPQVIASAADFAASNTDSILNNPDFVALRKRLGGENVSKISSITFIDLPRTARENYSGWLLISRYLGMADIFGVQSPLMVLPPLTKLTPHLIPAGSVTWSDDMGFHAKSISAFPGSEVLAQNPLGNMAVAEPAMMISILLPSLNRARETANRVKCASNLHQIGQGCILYSNENNGKYPPDLGTILVNEELGITAFVCPSTNTSIPANIRSGTKKQQADWVNEHSDYVYLGTGKTTTTAPDDIICYEKLDDHGGQGINILFGDGHVEFLSLRAAEAMIQKLTGAPGIGGGNTTNRPAPRLPTNGGL